MNDDKPSYGVLGPGKHTKDPQEQICTKDII